MKKYWELYVAGGCVIAIVFIYLQFMAPALAKLAE